MSNYSRSTAFLATALVVCMLWLPAQAAEVIHAFDSRVEMAADGQLTVTETIKVRAEGIKIRRGIYRDFPLMVKNAAGQERQVGFQIVSVTRDGKPDSTRVERGSRSVRIYIGKKDYFLPHGDYTYQLVYQTDRQIRYFEDHDELLWNATGNGWDFPILTATADITLPNGALATSVIAFTGEQGAKGKDATGALKDAGNRATFVTTKPLRRYEGLTVGVKFPKGIIAPPSDTQKAYWLLRDFKAEFISVGVLALLAVFYFWSWARIGVDPPRGVIVPRWDAPDGISPALTNYIYRKGLTGKGWDAVSAAILSLAVKGAVTLQGLGGDARIRLTGNAPAKRLPVGEAAIFRQVELAGGDLEISATNSSKIVELQSKFSSAMADEHRSKFYNHNRVIIFAGAAFSILGFIALMFAGDLSTDTLGTLMFLAVGGTVLTVMLVSLAKFLSSGRKLKSRLFSVIRYGVFGYIAFSGIIAFGSFASRQFDRPILMSAVVGVVMLNVLFFYLIGAPTPLGRKMMDGIEGLKHYLELAEEDRMNLAGPPKMSPEHFETLLPYAVALGVEKPWSDAFDKWLAAAVATGAIASAWHPHWYSGRDFTDGNIGQSLGAISDNMQNSFTAAMPAPSSSSSGFSGGGSSGGGGGGGGGGGW